jgi:peptide deformylase
MKVVTYPHPSLRFPARPIKIIDAATRKLVEEMTEVMFAHKGLGLAAPQVALPYQLFLMVPHGDATPEQVRVYINPVISDRKGTVEGEEGCLSFPQLYQKVRRAKQIRVRGFNQHGQPVDEVLQDLEARIVQHETDHLHGKLFIDYFGLIAKLASRDDLAAFEREYRREQQKGTLPADKVLLKQLEELAAAMPGPPPAGMVM